MDNVLGVDRSYMVMNRVLAQLQLLRDLFLSETVHQQMEHSQLGRRKPNFAPVSLYPISDASST